MKRDNINIILCDDIDSSLKNISNIRDVFEIEENRTISFTVVTFINGIQWDANNFNLYYYIRNLDQDIIAFLGCIEFVNDKESKKRSNGSLEKGSHENSSQSIADMKFDDVYVPNKGAYEIQVFKYENDEVIDLSDKEAKECIKYAREDHLVSVYSFEVE